MNKEAQLILNAIVKKEIAALTPSDIGFLNARATYLTEEQLHKFGPVLTFVQGRSDNEEYGFEQKEQDKEMVQEIDLKLAQKNKLSGMKYNDLLNLAKEVGFIQKKGKPKREDLELYVSQNT